MTHAFDPYRPIRRTNRLPTWDYRQPGGYFVTICTHERVRLFDEAPLREIAASVWNGLPGRYRAGLLTLDEWVVMPDHIHGILLIHSLMPGALTPPQADGASMPGPPATPLRNAAAESLGAVVGNYKSLVARRVNQVRRTVSEPVWQRGFYEHVLRTPDDLDRTRIYIRDNPARWAADHGTLDADLEQMNPHP